MTSTSQPASLVVFTHPACAGHDPVPGHPEQPARLAAVLAAFDSPGLTHCALHEAPRAMRDDLLHAHDRAHVDRVFAAGGTGQYRQLDPDTAMAEGSLEAALRAAGAAVAAVDHVMSGPRSRAFCAVRPPGHHATRATAMGFCLFNNIAIAAARALDVHGLQRVAICDFDVHHGNGSQAVFWNDARVLVASSHQWPLYPGSGRDAENGPHDTIVNAALPAGADGEAFRDAWRSRLLPRVDAFRPQLLLVSAGFDAHRDDPLAGLKLDEAEFGWLTGELVAIADRHSGGRIVSMLEGGYDLAALTASTRAHALALLR
ncbi:histone deacetylase family protein [Pseudofulvimonas gallinarii]|uniref:Acetoin utilization deacetylase AcuC-like enzyme n=1 Tax=Pseudofulvimonas gallinarii TaxID=634155 RepID=A0A4R3L0J2_9GAMM|nr:histone deacetylase family protein [Pseudofulvimonas gallinarii]TCS92866.1 acetoin utilization deacetylase AcuC-like enzyme [Pseudofulvimonas gallinarii]THD12457.1 acetoin utilization protein [Pseudofulvimonas gallinarii]